MDYIDVTDDEAIAEFRACMDKAQKIITEKGWAYVRLSTLNFTYFEIPYIDCLLEKLSEEIDQCAPKVSLNKSEILKELNAIKQLAVINSQVVIADLSSRIIERIEGEENDS